ncbi:2-oxoacid:ferredoxin oxidoreductase subunit beta [Thauera phenolivorans]|nr:2-oxoacid:ferredoxin oxidoreductase subunit beta [Thauera phenolivorans]
MNPAIEHPLTRKDFESDQAVRWCPGCGDHALLNQIQKLLPTLGIPREDFAFVSGIGCASRFPYYLDTYGMHAIHGRAPAIASGLKLARPELSVWVVTGDGDALAIGGNHFIHALRRNVGIRIVLLNNRIYGLTKGQASPTTELGEHTKSTPLGNVDRPFDPVALALGAGATFVARALDTDLARLGEVLRRAALHPGTAFVEVLQNCNMFADGSYRALTDRATRDEARIVLEHGRPLVFGAARDKGIRLRGLQAEVVAIGPEGAREDELLVHDERADGGALGFLLAQLAAPGFPVPLGVFRAVELPSCEARHAGLVAAAQARHGRGDLQTLLAGGNSWEIG